MSTEALREYQSMWLEDKEWYVLRKREDGTYSIVDLRHNAGVIIEDSTLAREVAQRMLDAGVPVVEALDLEFRKKLVRSRIGGKD